MSVDSMAKTFNLPIKKLEIDYKEKREYGHYLTREEIDYLRNDVQIVAMALDIMFQQNLTKMTIGSNALNEFKTMVGKKYFRKWFPTPEYDKDIRQSYRGGFTYLKPEYKDKDIDYGLVFDVNSLYPSVMYDCEFPYGEGIFFEGEYKTDIAYPLYVQMLRCQFELKKYRIPCIQIKNTLSFNPTEYLNSSNGEYVTLCLTSVDLKLFFEQYNVYDVQYLSGWKFKAAEGIFRDYIEKWNKVKVQATLDKNGGLRAIAKLMLNNLYGKFATNPVAQSKIPYLGEDNIVHYALAEPEEREPVYIPVGTFVTAWARDKTIRAAQSVFDRFIYADTDSLHLVGWEIPKELDISDTELGKWKLESRFTRARFLRQKTYLEEIDGSFKITCAGMPSGCYQYVTWDNFHPGTEYGGKLKAKRVEGGIVLLDSPHTLK